MMRNRELIESTGLDDRTLTLVRRHCHQHQVLAVAALVSCRLGGAMALPPGRRELAALAKRFGLPAADARAWAESATGRRICTDWPKEAALLLQPADSDGQDSLERAVADCDQRVKRILRAVRDERVRTPGSEEVQGSTDRNGYKRGRREPKAPTPKSQSAAKRADRRRRPNPELAPAPHVATGPRIRGAQKPARPLLDEPEPAVECRPAGWSTTAWFTGGE
jgi:hypothetical protein